MCVKGANETVNFSIRTEQFALVSKFCGILVPLENFKGVI